MTSGVKNLMYVHASLACLYFLLIVVYFPAKPPKPPSITASLQRTNIAETMKKILCNIQLWIIVVAGALPRSIVLIWDALFDVVVKRLGVSQTEAGWIGFWHLLTGNFAGMVIAKCSDLLSSRRKPLVLLMSIGGTLASIWTALQCDGTLNFNITSLYTSCILLGIFVHGLMPLFYEMAAETAYPVGEGTAGGLLTMVMSLFGIVYLGILSIPGIGTEWMTWACVGSQCLSLPLLIVFKENNKRYDIDIKL